ncbi:MAG: tRNA dihydrouridine synthase DusB [Acidimicrobiales bacterium]
MTAAVKIGPLVLDPPVVLAPMAGVTNSAFRVLCRSAGAGLYVSEMVTARALVEGNSRTMRMVQFAADEPCRSVQLYGVDPTVMDAAVRRLVDEIGVDHIDLNFGCPAAKVTRRGGGAALPAHPVLFRSIVRAAVRAAATVPVTVKLRIGIDDAHPTALTAGRIAADEGVAAVLLHARTAEQLYAGSADWRVIGELAAALDPLPVLGNGDIWEAEDALRMMEETSCAGVVVGRGALGRPWLFRDLAEHLAGRPVPPSPNLGEVATLMRQHARLLCEALGGEDRALRDFRKHVGWYLTGYPVGGDRRRRLGMVSTLTELDDGLGELDPATPSPPGAGRLIRGHAQGPRPVVLPHRWLEQCDDPTPPVGGDELVSGG